MGRACLTATPFLDPGLRRSLADDPLRIFHSL